MGEPDPATADLLSAAGVAPHIVAQLAGMDFQTAARHVAAWQLARAADKRVHVGALVTRLRTWGVPDDLTAAELQAGLLAGRVTAADLAAWGVTLASDSYVPAGFEHIIQY